MRKQQQRVRRRLSVTASTEGGEGEVRFSWLCRLSLAASVKWDRGGDADGPRIRPQAGGQGGGVWALAHLMLRCWEVSGCYTPLDGAS